MMFSTFVLLYMYVNFFSLSLKGVLDPKFKIKHVLCTFSNLSTLCFGKNNICILKHIVQEKQKVALQF